MTPTGQPRRPGRALAALAGFAAAAAGLAAGELAAAVTGPATSPVLVVAAAVADLTPTGLEQWAIRTFGSSDKLVLVAGVLVVLAAVAAAAGVLARRRLAAGGAIVLGFAAVGVTAALTRPAAEPLDVLPSALAGLTALGVLAALARTAAREPADTVPVRRRLLIASAATVGLAALVAVTGRFLQARLNDVTASRAAVRLPQPVNPAPVLPAGHQLKLPGLKPYFTPNSVFYRVDTALSLPAVPAEEWTLRVIGDVDRPMELTFDELLARELTERDLTLCCVSNQVGGPLVGTARWLGPPLGELLREAGVSAKADQLLSRSADGMTIGTPLSMVLDGRDALLCVGMNGEPLPLEHGFPARMIVPGLYGYTSATKWVVELRATRFDQIDAYWTARGWDPRGVVKTMSRIDVPRVGGDVRAGRVTVAGSAWAQHRGISAVQVRMDGGRWQDAQLTAPVGDDTWRQWRSTFDAPAGVRRFQVRAADGNGDLQPSQRTTPYPAGASGWHTVAVTVRP